MFLPKYNTVLHPCFSHILRIHRHYSLHIPKTMSAWQIHNFGGTEQLTLNHKVEIPHITDPKDVIVQVHAASVNPIDIDMLGGYGQEILSAARKIETCQPDATNFPITFGRDFSGVVLQTGRGVRKFKPGDEVWGCSKPWSNQGHHAQYSLVSSTSMSKKPSNISHIEAASIPYVAMTTWGALCFTGGMTPETTHGKRVLVYGGSGGIGTFAIQLLRSWGAEVTTTCSTDAVEMVTTLGADFVIDYKEMDLRHELLQIKGFDVIFDTVGSESSSFNLELLRANTGAQYITIKSPLLKNTDKHGLLFGGIKSALKIGKNLMEGLPERKHYRWGYFMPSSSGLKTFAEMVEKSHINPFVEKVFSFEDVPCAFEKIKAGSNRGKTVIDIVGSKKNEERNENNENT